MILKGENKKIFKNFKKVVSKSLKGDIIELTKRKQQGQRAYPSKGDTSINTIDKNLGTTQNCILHK